MIVYLNNFEINTEASRYYIDEELVGLGLPEVRNSQGLYSGQDGGYVAAQYFGMRSISIVGRVFGEDVADIEERRRALMDVLAEKKITMRIITNAGKDYVIQTNLVSFDMPIQRVVTIAPFKLELVAPDPVIYDYTGGTELSASVPKIVGGGYTFPIVYPVIWAMGTQPTNIQNNGTATIWPKVTISGAATNPRITNVTSGRFFTFDGLTMGVNDVLEIDMKNKTVLLNGGSVYYLVTTDSRWLSLAPGDNLISYSTDASGDTVPAIFTWRNGFWGI